MPLMPKTGHGGRFGITCGKLATKEALFKLDGIIVIEKYCDAAWVQVFERIWMIHSELDTNLMVGGNVESRD